MIRYHLLLAGFYYPIGSSITSMFVHAVRESGRCGSKCLFIRGLTVSVVFSVLPVSCISWS